MRNICLKISYDGSRFFGSQIQPKVVTVQGTLENILSGMLRENVKTVFSSRTDKGVHALGCYVNFLTENPLPLESFYTLNKNMSYIKIRKVFEADSDFSARYSATEKTYMFLIDKSKNFRPFLYDYAWNINEPLDIDLMKKASKFFIGTHDFKNFSKKRKENEKTVRTIKKIKVVTGSKYIKIFITGNSFLYNMVRFMVYALYLTGSKKIPFDSIKDMLLYCNKYRPAGKALPGGLYLMDVYYCTDHAIKYCRRKA